MAAAVPVTGMIEPEMKLAWITGANGLIGSYLVQTVPQYAPHWPVRALTRDQFDLLDFPTVRRQFESDRPRLIIHCAALTIVAEVQKRSCLRPAGECRSHPLPRRPRRRYPVRVLFHRPRLRRTQR